MWVKIYGAPGTGKTTYLAKTIVDRYPGKNMRKVLFISFSNAAIDSIREKIEGSYKGATLHSIATSFAKSSDSPIQHLVKNTFKRNPVAFVEQEFTRFCIAHHIPLTFNNPGEKALTLWERICNTYYPIYQDLNKLISIYEKECRRLGGERYIKILFDWMQWKKKKGVVDFIDIMMNAYDNIESLERMVSKYEYGFFDEAQDFSPLEWEIVLAISNNMEECFFAGDDAQSIYTFKGARPDEFLTLDCDEEKVLPKSWRLPRRVLDYSMKILKTMKKKKFKNISPANEGGVVAVNSWKIHEILLHAVKTAINENKKTMILVRTNSQLEKILEKCISVGMLPKMLKVESQEFFNIDLPRLCWAMKKMKNNSYEKLTIEEVLVLLKYTKKQLEEKYGIDVKTLIFHIKKSIKEKQSTLVINEFKNFISKINWPALIDRSEHPELRRFLKNPVSRRAFFGGLTPLGNLYIDTFHSSKGLEADVVYFIDAWPNTFIRDIRDVEDIDDELRVSYVGATRAREKLYIVECQELGIEFLSAIL